MADPIQRQDAPTQEEEHPKTEGVSICPMH